MKLPLSSALAAAFILPAALVHADLVMVQDTLVGEVATRTTMSVKGNKVRTDNGDTASVIMDTATGDMTTLMHEQKMVMTMNTKTLQASLPAGKEQPVPGHETKVTATGKKETVDGHECEIYYSEAAGQKVKMWMALSYPNLEKLKAEMAGMAKMAGVGAGKTAEIPGIMVKSEYEQSGLKFTTRLISMELKPVSDEVFKLPADYKSMGQ
jgi:hypothetical protein